MPIENHSVNTQIDHTKTSTLTGEGGKSKGWIKRIGVAAFLFFLIKGIFWLLIFFGIFKSLN